VTGVREFLRIPEGMEVMGDCGAFTYVKEEEPPVTVEEVVRFYQDSGFNYGASVDHVILEYNPSWDHILPGVQTVPDKCVKRQEITLELACEFQKHCKKEKVTFEPLGVAQGWSPNSYAKSLSALQKMGYRYIALGGMVPLKSNEIADVLKTCNPRLRSDTRLHLFGVTRLSHVKEFASLGVVSFDSTSPLRQAFKEEKDNYYAKDRTYTAIPPKRLDSTVDRVSGDLRQLAKL